MVLCLEVVVAFLIQVSVFHDPVRNKDFFPRQSPVSEKYRRLIDFFNPQAHWTDLLGAMCILAAVTAMGFESKVMEKFRCRFL